MSEPTETVDRGPFPSPSTAFKWYFREVDGAASAKAFDPSRQQVDGGGGNGTTVVRGMLINRLGLRATISLCVKQAHDVCAPMLHHAGVADWPKMCATERLLRWGYLSRHSPIQAELSGYDAKHLDRLWKPVSRFVRDWLDERGVLRRD